MMDGIISSIENRKLQARIEELEKNLADVVEIMQDMTIILGNMRDINQVNNFVDRNTDERIKKVERMLGVVKK